MKPNTDSNGREFDLPTRLSVWRKGSIIPGYPQEAYRKDACGKVMKWAEYGNIHSDLGWEVDHVKPRKLNGGDELTNLQPLQWRNNRVKGDNYPNWSCAA
jgi:5-methylcytosine-specific restriction endonuclease McrA